MEIVFGPEEAHRVPEMDQGSPEATTRVGGAPPYLVSPTHPIQWSLGDLFDVTLFTVYLLGSDELCVYDQIYVFIHESYLSLFDLLYA